MPAMRCCHSSTTRGLTCFCLLLRLLLLVLSSSTTTEFVSGWMLSPHTATTRNANANANARARATVASLPNRRRAEHPSFSFSPSSSPSSSFSFSRTTSCLLRQAQQQQDNDFRDNDNDDGDEGDGEMEFFDDFGFVVGGDNNYNSYSYSYSYSSEEEEPSGEGSPPRNRNPEEAESESELSSLSILQERLERVATTEQGNQQQISDNWKEGYWGVWGCSLDPYGGEGDETETETSQKTVVTCVRKMPFGDFDCYCYDEVDDDDDDDGLALLIVGRSDGSLCWLQVETLSSPSSSSSSSSSSTSSSSSPSSLLGSDNDATSIIQGRSITTYFENKLAARPTDDGGMVVGTSLQRRDDNNDDNSSDNNNGNSIGNNNKSSTGRGSASPFELLAQTPPPATSTPTATSAAIIDVLPLPRARMVWTIAEGTPTTIQGWNLGPHRDGGGALVPIMGTTTASASFEIPSIHASPIVAMKAVPVPVPHNAGTTGKELVVTVSTDGRVVVWEASQSQSQSKSKSKSQRGGGEIRVRLDANLLRQQWNDNAGIGTGIGIGTGNENESILSMDLDENYLYLGSSDGRILIFDLSGIQRTAADNDNNNNNDDDDDDADVPLASLPLLKSFLGFTSRNPGVSTLLAAGPGTLGNTNGNTNGNGNGNGNGNAGGNRPPTKSLIAGDMTGGLKQWDLLPAGRGRLEYWPRMASQKLPGGRPHVYETRGDYYSHSEDDEGGTPWSPAIRGLLCIQQRVLLAATDHDLTVWDSETGKALYDMQGLNFGLGVGVGVGGASASASASDAAPLHRPSLVAANDSVLITNGMEQLVCVHDFAMDRVTSETVEDFLERDTTDGLEDDERGSNPGERW